MALSLIKLHVSVLKFEVKTFVLYLKFRILLIICVHSEFFKNYGLQAVIMSGADRIWPTDCNVLTPGTEYWESSWVHQIFVVAFEVSSVLGIHENIVFFFYVRCHWSSVLCFTWITTEIMLFRVEDMFIITQKLLGLAI